MKKVYLIPMILVPALIGYVYNMLLLIPILGTLLLYILPLAMLVYWFWVGSKFAEFNWSLPISILVGNSFGILSLIIYFWQFLFITDSERNLFLAALSQMFTSCTNIFVARVAILFEPDKNVVGQVSFTAVQILGLIFMMIIFAIGYIWSKKKARANEVACQ